MVNISKTLTKELQSFVLDALSEGCSKIVLVHSSIIARRSRLNAIKRQLKQSRW